MIPLVGEARELKFVKDVVVKVADELIAESGLDMKYHIGTMIEIPRAAVTADEIAKEAEFFSFGHQRPDADDLRLQPRRTPPSSSAPTTRTRSTSSIPSPSWTRRAWAA